MDAKDDKDTVICAKSKDGVVRPTKRTVSHYSIVEQPGDNPLGFFVPDESTGIACHITDILIKQSNRVCLRLKDQKPKNIGWPL